MGMTEELRFDGQVAFVTGGAGGIGSTYCRMLAARGAKVVVNGKGSPDQARMDEVVDRIRTAGGDATGVSGDVCDDATVKGMIAETIGKYGRLDILINNAGTSDNTMDITAAPDQRLEAQLDIHLRAPMRMTRAAWKHLAASGSGRIINIGSASAYGVFVPGTERGMDGKGAWEAAYSTAKCAVFAVTRQMAGAGAEHGIKANMIIPWSWSLMTKANLEGTPFGDWMQKNMRPELVGAVALYLAHRECPSSGQFFSAAGGRVTRVLLGSLRGYFNRELTPEDVRANWGKIFGHAAEDGYLSEELLDIRGVETEFVELQRYLGS
jgi:NAD(P)-dependent dehydrogenase (short-subunit alcohol dehydrogenase family)